MYSEKRKEIRISIKNGIYAVIKPEDGRMGQIINISSKGLMMRYIEGIFTNLHSSMVEITYPENKIILDNIPLKSLNHIKDEDNEKIYKYLRLEFDNLNMVQYFFINYIMKKYKVKSSKDYKTAK